MGLSLILNNCNTVIYKYLCYIYQFFDFLTHEEINAHLGLTDEYKFKY
jgi:hypothetical protein